MTARTMEAAVGPEEGAEAMVRNVVVTGGTLGIGLGVVLRLAAEGWRPSIVDLDPAGEAVAAEVGGTFARADVADPDAVADALATIAGTVGTLHGLVCSAGINRTGPAEEISIADWRRVIDVDLNGTYYACRAAFPHLAPGSAIVNVASIMAVRARAGRAPYSAAKAGVMALTRSLAIEWVDRGIRVNAVAPSWTDTPLIRGQVAGGTLSLDVLDRVPMGRLVTVEEVADAVSFLLGDRAAFITGQTLFVDGGFVAAG